MIGNVYPFWRCFKVLPLVYDESLSYYEVLCKLTYKINEVIEQLSSDYSDIYEYIDQQDKFTLNSANNYTDSKVSELELVINNQFTVLSDAIKSADQKTRSWVTEQITDLTIWLEQQGQSIYVINPITGYTDTIQNVLNDFYNYFNYYALTCIEYDGLNLTADMYDAKNITCYQYDFYAKKYLTEDDRFYMFNPVTGQRVFYKNVIDFLVSLHREDALTCAGYDDKNITTDGYDNYDITTYQYDWEGKTVLAVA